MKNGSERVVDDARSHIGTIKMLRNFYYVDEKGKDQGINGTICMSCTLLPTAHDRLSAKPFEGACRPLGRR